MIWLQAYLVLHVLASLALIGLMLWPPMVSQQQLKDNWLGIIVAAFIIPIFTVMALMFLHIKCLCGYHKFVELYFWDMYSIRGVVRALHKLELATIGTDVPPGCKVHQCSWCNKVRSTSADSAV